MTAEDILRRNPRYLTQSKSFDTFFSFGPQLVTPDEIDDVFKFKVTTVINGRVHAENTVDHMTFPPDELIHYHSQIMTLTPGDVISTGTPGATPIQDGDEVECRIDGFEPLKNPVIDLKRGAGSLRCHQSRNHGSRRWILPVAPPIRIRRFRVGRIAPQSLLNASPLD